jgi:hypothetical protein
MQPSLILPIILKDLRANRWLFAAFFAASVLSTASSFLNPQNLGPLAGSGMFLVYCLYTLLCPATIKNGSRRQLEMTPGDNYKKRSSSG